MIKNVDKLNKVFALIFDQISLVLFVGLTLNLSILPCSTSIMSQLQVKEPIIDCEFKIDEVFADKKIPSKIRSNLRLISVEYFSFDNQLHRGQILINKDLIKDITEIFEIIKNKKFPIGKVIPINQYNWSDELSMDDNNTSAFNYRYVKGTNKLSSHALGRAIDINPNLNPQIKKGKTFPVNSKYDKNIEGTISPNSFLVKEFTKRGWKWGGFWKSHKDYQHFEKMK